MPRQTSRSSSGAREATAGPHELAIGLCPAVEYGVDRIERPGLVEDDLIVEQALAVEDDTGIAEIVEEAALAS